MTSSASENVLPKFHWGKEAISPYPSLTYIGTLYTNGFKQNPGQADCPESKLKIGTTFGDRPPGSHKRLQRLGHLIDDIKDYVAKAI